MNTTADKLNKLIATKKAIKAAIEAKGVTDVGERFADYPDKILQIPSPEYEVVNLTLTTNQATHDVLLGKVIHVKYATEDKPYAWHGVAITVKIPKYVSYSIEFPTVKGYRPPGNVSYTAVGGNTRNLTVSYDTEMLTVNVSCDVPTVDLTGQEITINGVAYQTPSDRTIVVKIPFGKTYDIVASARAGFNIPEKQSFTASQATRGVSVIYTKISLGVFILGTDGNLYSANEWSKPNGSAIGVVVLTNECKFMVSKGPSYSSNWSAWGEGALNKVDGVTTTTSSSDAKRDYKGVQNTASIVSKYGRETYAAYQCSSFTFNNGKKGYLGAAGEWMKVFDNLSAVNTCMSKIGGEEISNSDYYWTSTQYNASDAWVVKKAVLSGLRKVLYTSTLPIVLPFAQFTND